MWQDVRTGCRLPRFEIAKDSRASARKGEKVVRLYSTFMWHTLTKDGMKPDTNKAKVVEESQHRPIKKRV